MKRAYYYLFYKMFKFSEASPSRWLSDWKASFVLDMLLLLFITSILNYYKAFLDPTSTLGEGLFLFILMVLVSVFNYFFFHHHQQWKAYCNEFDKLKKKDNTKGGWIVFGLIILILFNFIASFYFYYQS